jgi:hypothetical protein
MQKIKNMIASLGRVVENVNLYVNKDQLKGLNKKIVRAIKEIPVKGRANYAKRMYEKVNVYDLRIKNLEMILLEKSLEFVKISDKIKSHTTFAFAMLGTIIATLLPFFI